VAGSGGAVGALAGGVLTDLSVGAVPAAADLRRRRASGDRERLARPGTRARCVRDAYPGYRRALLCAALGMVVALGACLLMARQPRSRMPETQARERAVAGPAAVIDGGAVAQTEVR
jgi:hypothetical protein